jgi:hypothetical protein
VTARLPVWRSHRLRRATWRMRRADPAGLPVAVEAVVAELEALIPRWLALRPATSGREHDERLLRERERRG